MTSREDKSRQAFKEEAYELLSGLESSLLELEKRPDEKELISEVFRALHTIKGSGAMFGFDDIAEFTHTIETAFDMVRNGTIPVTKELIDITLSARDCIKSMLNNTLSESEDGVEPKTIIDSLKDLIPEIQESRKQDKATEALSEKVTAHPISNAGNVTYRIRFRPSRNIFLNGTNPVLLLKELCQLGDCRVFAHTDAIPKLEEYESDVCYTYWDIILTTRYGMDDIRDVFVFVGDDSAVKIDVVDDSGRLNEEIDHKKLGEILLERGDLSTEALQKALSAQKRIGELLIDSRIVDDGKVESALMEQRHIREIRESRQKSESVASIRVPSERLDSLVDLIGELVTVQARLSQTAALQQNPEMLTIAEAVERITENLRDNTLSLRMVPIGSTFSRFRRLVRDLSNELGKKVELVTEGAETELDKTVIERLSEPLVHLIRNSIGHGIQKPKIRETLGKPRKGTVHLSAMHSGGSVLIEVRDDGKGLDKEAIRTQALEKGLISEDADLTDKEIYALILLPGFTTAENVTNVSGRGVGMDVVKRSLDALRGSIEISSREGIGTSITLRLPLTLAIIDGLLVKIGEDCFVIPLSTVEECIELTREDIAHAHGRHIANVRGGIIPYIRLREKFEITGEPPDREQIVITESNGYKVGFVVDTVIGGHQTVIKTLGRVYKDVEGISGATILGDGTVALILDVQKLVNEVERETVST